MLYNLNNIDKIFYNNKEYSSMYIKNKEIWYDYLEEEPIFVTIKTLGSNTSTDNYELNIVKNNEIINTIKKSVYEAYCYESFNIQNLITIRTSGFLNFYNINKNDGNYSIYNFEVDSSFPNFSDIFLKYGFINGTSYYYSRNRYMYYDFYYKGELILHFMAWFHSGYYKPVMSNCQFRNFSKFDNEADNYLVISKLQNSIGYPVQKVIKIKDDNYEVLDGENSIFKNKYIKIVKLLDGNSVAKKAYYQDNWIFEYCILDKDYNEITIENKYNLINSIGDSIGMELYRDKNYIYFYDNNYSSSDTIITITDKDCNTLINTITLSNCKVVKWKNNRLFAIENSSTVYELNLSPDSITYGNKLLENKGEVINILY